MAWDVTGSGSFSPTLEVIYPSGSPVARSTEQPLLALTELGVKYSDLKFTLRNHDLTNKAAFYVDESESGVAADEEREIVIVGPGMERSITFRDVMSRYFGVSASGDPDAAFPSVQVSFQVLGRRRLGK